MELAYRELHCLKLPFRLFTFLGAMQKYFSDCSICRYSPPVKFWKSGIVRALWVLLAKPQAVKVNFIAFWLPQRKGQFWELSGTLKRTGSFCCDVRSKRDYSNLNNYTICDTALRQNSCFQMCTARSLLVIVFDIVKHDFIWGRQGRRQELIRRWNTERELFTTISHTYFKIPKKENLLRLTN